MRMLHVIKIGGNILDNEDALQRFISNFALIQGPKVVVHGGGKLATRLSEVLEIPTKMVEGRRVTDFATLRVVCMVYAGWINKNLVAQLQAKSCNAIGLSGADGNSIPASRRNPEPIDFGYVGDIAPGRINIEFIKSLIDQDITPVFCAITHDKKGSLLNSNADSVASALAIALSSVYNTRLSFCFEKQGVLANPEDDKSVIPHIFPEYYQQLKEEGIITDGMIPKIDNAFKALELGVREVFIKHADTILTGAGTRITLEE